MDILIIGNWVTSIIGVFIIVREMLNAVQRGYKFIVPYYSRLRSGIKGRWHGYCESKAVYRLEGTIGNTVIYEMVSRDYVDWSGVTTAYPAVRFTLPRHYSIPLIEELDIHRHIDLRQIRISKRWLFWTRCVIIGAIDGKAMSVLSGGDLYSLVEKFTISGPGLFATQNKVRRRVGIPAVRITFAEGEWARRNDEIRREWEKHNGREDT